MPPPFPEQDSHRMNKDTLGIEQLKLNKNYQAYCFWVQLKLRELCERMENVSLKIYGVPVKVHNNSYEHGTKILQKLASQI